MKSCRWHIALVLAVSLFLVFPGCASSGPKVPAKAPDYSRVKGYMIRPGEIKAGSFETPPYIPTRVRFLLEQQLREKQLLASGGDQKVLTVNIVSSAYYTFFRREHPSSYDQLTSTVEVVDTSQPEIIAKTTITSYNGFGDSTSDFTEIDHVRQIVKFLEGIVR
jgi:hypothetical protein